MKKSEEKAPSKKSKKKKELQAILEMREPPALTADRVASTLEIDVTRAQYLLRELTINGKIDKFGKGKSAIYKHKELESEGKVNGLLNAVDSMKVFLKVSS